MRLQTAHRQALTDGRQDYLRAATREEINDKVPQPATPDQKAQEELQQVNGCRWRPPADIWAVDSPGCLPGLGRDRHAGISRVERGKTTRRGADGRIGANPNEAGPILDQLLANKVISAEEARRRALASVRRLWGCHRRNSTDHRQQDRPACARRRAVPPERAKAALAAGNYDAGFTEAGKQRREPRPTPSWKARRPWHASAAIRSRPGTRRRWRPSGAPLRSPTPVPSRWTGPAPGSR